MVDNAASETSFARLLRLRSMCGIANLRMLQRACSPSLFTCKMVTYNMRICLALPYLPSGLDVA